MEWRINPTDYLNRTPDGRLSGGHVSSAALIWGPHRMLGRVHGLLLKVGLFTIFTDINPPSSGTLITYFFSPSHDIWNCYRRRYCKVKRIVRRFPQMTIWKDICPRLEGWLSASVEIYVFHSESKCNFPLIISYLSIPWGSWLLAWASRGWTFFNHNVTDGPVGRDHFLRATLNLRGMWGYFVHTGHLREVRAFVHSIRVAFS